MIVELTNEQLATLVMDREPVTIQGVTVRVGQGVVLLEASDEPAPTRTEQVREQRSDARAALTGGDPVYKRRARYDGQCNANCGRSIAAGEQMIRDRAQGKNYCVPCGEHRFPMLAQRPAA